MMKDEAMRKEGENIIKPPPGKAAIRSTKIIFHPWCRKSNVPLWPSLSGELIVDEIKV
jgi:hypothetical protein